MDKWIIGNNLMKQHCLINNLNMKDYKHAKRVWKNFEIKRLAYLMI